MDIPELLTLSVQKQASDLHLSAGLPPMLRVHGDIVALEAPPLSAADIRTMLDKIMTEDQQLTYHDDLECDFSYSLPGVSRFRVNAFHQERGPSAAFRTIPATVQSLEELALPPICAELAMRPRGLVLVTGPTGSGKSTTLAAMLNHINRNMPAHVLTIEDPIEFLHTPHKALINQREVNNHTLSFNNALRSALREDPDVIMIGELRDIETIRLAMTAAETGHLVLASLHTSSAAKTIDRIIGVFSPEEKELMRTMLSESLEGVVSQTLVRNKAGDGRVAAHEIMIATPAIRNLIREGKTAQMYSTIQTSGTVGMQTLDQSLERLSKQGQISAETAKLASRTPGKIKM